jgi:iron complex outermembrane recepter protein
MITMHGTSPWARSRFIVGGRTVAGFGLLLALILGIAPQLALAGSAQLTEEIVVTGSRIVRDDFTSSSPITVITGDSIRQSGMSNLGEALRQQVVIGTGGFNQTSTLSGSGASSIDLRNLGPDRVLVLINGKRVANFTDSLSNLAADLTFVPTAMVERVEILRDGASSVYGSDAVSGVVNVILKRNFEGANLSLNGGLTSENDGEQAGVALTLGTSGDQGSLVFGAEYRKQANIRQKNRDWATPAYSALGATSFNHGSIFSPGGLFLADNGTFPFCTDSKAFGGDEVTNQAPACEGFSAPALGQITRYDYALVQDLVNSFEITSLSGYGTYEIAPSVRATLELQFAKRESESQLDANPGSFGTPTYPQGSYVPATNPNNPTGLGGIFLFRPTSTLGPRTQDVESNTLRVVTGVEGDISPDYWFRDDWKFEVSYLYTRVDADMVTNSTWNLARFIRISDPVACASDPACSQVVNPSGALDSLRPGNWTAAEIEYLRQNASSRSEFETTSLFGVITGSLFDLPAGPLSAAVGFEIRQEKGLNKPDSVTEAGESVANQTFTTKGNFDVDELFAEVDIPILRNVPLAESLSLNFQGRVFDYSNFGSDDVWSAGINWQVIPDLRLRGKWGTAFRAPTITNLFGGGTVSFDFFTDACMNPSDRQPGNNVDQNCNLDGIPIGTEQITSQYPVLAGSNPDLQPETADTSTMGLVFTPRFVQGLSVSIDLWRIKVKDLISRPTSDSILRDCYAGPVGLTAPECAQFGRGAGPGFVPINFVNRLSNLSEVKTKGFDWGVNYTFDGPMETSWLLNWQGTYVEENTFFPEQGGANDRGSIPRIKSTARADVDWQQWSFGWQTRYIHSMKDPLRDGNNAFNYRSVRAHVEHDLRVGYEWNNINVLLGVNDVFDEDPPYVFSSGNNTDTFLYDVLGRYFFLQVSVDFNR